MSPRDTARWPRETRLLLVTISISVAALLVLAQFRFPEERIIEAPPQPLERLAARATYDELAAIVQRVEQRIAPSVIVFTTTSAVSREPRSLATLLQPREGLGGNLSSIVGLRIRPDLALARLSPGLRVEGVLNDPEAVPLVIAEDPIRQIGLIRVPPPADATEWRWQPADGIVAPRYVVTIEGSRGGPLPRPVFLGRAERIEDPRWGSALVVLARTPVTSDGALVFSLEGALLGLAAQESGVLAIVPAAELARAGEALFEAGSPVVIDFGLTFQTLTAELVRTLGVTGGVVIADVAAGSPSHGRLQPGDIIQSVDDLPVSHPDALLLRLARVPPSARLLFAVRRGAQQLTIEVPATRQAADPENSRRPRRP